MKKIITLLVLACGAVPALAQEYPLESRIRFQVWNGSAWTSSTITSPGAPVQWRTVVSYTGPRTDLTAMGLIRYQPVFSNTDNIGKTLTLLDRVGFLRSDRVLSASEAAATGSIPGGGGRVTYGNTATNTTNQNVLTVFRHTDGTGHAPAGSYIRIAGSYVADWPPYPLPHPGWPVSPSHLMNLITKGVTSDQLSQALRPTTWAGGTTDLVVFRGEFTPSNESIVGISRDVTLSTIIGSFHRPAGITSIDNRRCMVWQTGPTDSGSYRTSIEISPATITVRPPSLAAIQASPADTGSLNPSVGLPGTAPIAWATFGVAGLCLMRRPRKAA